MAHNLSYKKKPPPDVWGMNKNKSPYGTTQSDGIREDTLGPEGPPNYSNNPQYPPIQQPTQEVTAMADEYPPYTPNLGGFNQDTYSGRPDRRNDQNRWFNGQFNYGNMNLADEGSYTDKTLDTKFDPFQDFKWGMNMPTFQVGKGIFDTGIAGLGAFNEFRNYGLRQDMFEDQKRIGDRDYFAAKDLQNVKFDDIDHTRLVRNNFTDIYGGPEGKYIKQDPINRRTLAS